MSVTRLLTHSLGILLLGAPATSAQEIQAPIQKVILYKSGVGFFQHQTRVNGSQSVEIPLSSEQLDDALKSLTVLDLNGGRLGEITYDSLVPLARQLEEIPIDLKSVQGLVQILRQIRGAEVEVALPGTTVIGRILDAEIRRQPQGDAVGETVELSLFDTSGSIRLLDLSSAGALSLKDPALAAELSRYLEVVQSGFRQQVRNLRIAAEGTGERSILISYVAEAPIWKATYRIVLRPAAEALLQGWAVVDNTTPSDWNEIQLSLVSGAPVTFVYRLSEAVYPRRPEVPLVLGPGISPRIHEGALVTDEASVPLEKAEQAPRARAGRFSEMVAAAAPASPDYTIENYAESVEAQAQGATLGELFEYRISESVSIRRNHSALIPILQAPAQTEKVTVFNEREDARNPRLAIWLLNDSDLTLDGGVFTIIEENAFAGEGLFETIQKGERRLLSYAVDLGVEVGSRLGSDQRSVERVTLRNGVLTLIRKRVDTKTYSIRNRSESERTLILEHPVRSGWELASRDKPVETTQQFYRFRVPIKPDSTTTFSVQEERPEREILEISEMAGDQLLLWIRDRKIPASVLSNLERIAEKKKEVSELELSLQQLGNRESSMFRDQERIRENLGRLNRTPEEAQLRQRYIDQLEQQENELASLRAERAALESSLEAARKTLAEMIAKLSFDEGI